MEYPHALPLVRLQGTQSSGVLSIPSSEWELANHCTKTRTRRTEPKSIPALQKDHHAHKRGIVATPGSRASKKDSSRPSRRDPAHTAETENPGEASQNPRTLMR